VTLPRPCGGLFPGALWSGGCVAGPTPREVGPAAISSPESSAAGTPGSETGGWAGGVCWQGPSVPEIRRDRSSRPVGRRPAGPRGLAVRARPSLGTDSLIVRPATPPDGARRRGWSQRVEFRGFSSSRPYTLLCQVRWEFLRKSHRSRVRRTEGGSRANLMHPHPGQPFHACRATRL